MKKIDYKKLYWIELVLLIIAILVVIVLEIKSLIPSPYNVVVWGVGIFGAGHLQYLHQKISATKEK